MRQLHSIYPVRGVPPVRSETEGRDRYLHIATSFPSSVSIVEFTSRPFMHLVSGSKASERAFVPVIDGHPKNGTIQISGLVPRISSQEIDALSKFAQEAGIAWFYDHKDQVASVLSNTLHTALCVTAEHEILAFEGISSEAIILAGLRAFAEQRQ